MRKIHSRTFASALILFLLLGFAFYRMPSGAAEAVSQDAGQEADPAPLQAATPIFRFPVVPGSTLSGHFDHWAQPGSVVFFDGRRNNPGAGFYFQCSNPAMYDWVGCLDSVAGEAACSNDRELWYDNHRGTDYEYASNWHTGAYCNPSKFSGITSPVTAPARGKVHFAGYDANRPGNGWHIRMKHDLNGNGNFDDDNFRSIYLHFTAYALAVVPGQVVEEGEYLGLGGSTGYSSSPHLHFEVQKSSDYFQYSYWSVDPYGWSGEGGDPWGYANAWLWRTEPEPEPEPAKEALILSVLTRQREIGCPGCGELLRNGNFEAGEVNWWADDEFIIDNSSNPRLPTAPLSGSWLAWLGGSNNANDILYQEFNVPEGTTDGVLRYGFRMHTEENGGIYDTIYVRLRKPDGTIVQQLDYVDNNFTPRNQWVVREIRLPDLDAYQNQKLRLSFEAVTDSNSVTHFFVDDVSLVASAP